MEHCITNARCHPERSEARFLRLAESKDLRLFFDELQNHPTIDLAREYCIRAPSSSAPFAEMGGKVRHCFIAGSIGEQPGPQFFCRSFGRSFTESRAVRCAKVQA